MTTKNEARKNVKEIRKKTNSTIIDELSCVICSKLISLKCYSESKTLFLYNSINNEVNTNELISYSKKCGKILAFPAVIGEEMLFYRIDSEKDIKTGYMGIIEPIPSPDRLLDLEAGVIIVPGVAFDRKCNRAGYGKGFYDRYLAKHKKLVKIGLGFDFQIFDELVTDEYDIPLDYVITENEIYKSGE